MRRGFTLIEFLIVIGILGAIIVLSVSAFSFLIKKTDLDSSINNIISIVNLAKNKTLASEGAKQYGVYFDAIINPNKYVLFQGSSYALRDISLDEIHNLPAAVKISSISFGGLGNEIVFDRLTGTTGNSGTLVINSLKTNDSKIIYVYPSGVTSFNPESVSGTGRISDSRHIHFNLGWSIAGATALKFDFINSGQIKQVAIADYFSLDGFNWEGEFTINGNIQRFRIHIHQLNPTTNLCIHRDRDQGRNNEEVYIYIVQGGIEKEIVHYDNDQSATAYKGNYVWEQMEIQ